MFKKLLCRQSAVAAFLVLFLAILIAAVPVMAAEQPYPPGAPPSFADLAAKVKNSVVNISTTQVVEKNPKFVHVEQICVSFFADSRLPSTSLMAAAAAINDKCVRP